MVTEVVVKESLSTDMISAGAELTRLLDESRLIVSASLWLYIPETNVWRFVIGSPEVRTHGPRKAYKKIQSVVSKMSEDQPKIPLKDITVVDSNDPLISLLRVAIGTTGNVISDIRVTHNVINGVLIEDAYIYRIT
jgi:hypothetical protein